jgi:peptidoglycan/xylan/chitin deacetylase (PgdA/CDA1 family)
MKIVRMAALIVLTLAITAFSVAYTGLGGRFTVTRLKAAAVSAIAPAGRNCRGYIALTFDDGPSATTPRLLAILTRAHATAAFFDVGAHEQRYPAAVRQEARIGQVGNHSYDHPFLDEMPYQAVYRELIGTGQITASLTGATPWMFRPPFDRVGPQVTRAQYQLGLDTVLWNVDSEDYDGISPAAIVARVSHLHPGDVVLFHDGPPATLQALPAVLTSLRRQGLCTGEILPSRHPHFAWPTQSYGNVVFYARVAPPGTPLRPISGLSPAQLSTAVVPASRQGE